MLTRIFLWVNVFVLGSIGGAYLIDPNLLLGFYGLSLGSVGLDNMMRATYGGLFVGLAVLLVFAVMSTGRQRDAVILVSVVMGGLALGRLASLLGAGMPPSNLFGLLFYEAIVAGLGAVMLFKTAR
ncbi:MAG: DUF4345 family protein [Pseudomonadota bacterium]